MILDLWKKCLMCLTNGFEKKLTLQVFKIYVFLLFPLYFKLISCTNTAILPKIWDKIFLNYVFLFSLRVKLRNATIYPPWGLIFKKYFFQKHTSPSSEMQNLFRRWHLKDIEEMNHGLKKKGPYKSQLNKKWVGALHFRENGLAITCTWPYQS